ncbi:methyltransferase domain-containing protein [Methanoculleus sp. FWC-SCC1]|uniref:Methyltransferase domain-containing protein n=1 Tax=Methanoculleus frigidifontis TaxID=2584085 RepID=A0ABT8ME72_9EURY|nr:class I SAM-dependent methyltransferase [Methanoculleus sp. FWC-SCC1]MDN7026150.1 methyltransferase domain-containing protein [Methanoculleus sp. FWC-SCC1]
MKQRIKETDQGIQGELDVERFDRMQRHLRDKGLIATDDIIASGIAAGRALELGPGPGYLGLEWLRRIDGTDLAAVEISRKMIDTARRNAEEYGLASRARYTHARVEEIPFADGTFDAVFSNGSLHEWSDPERAFGEIYRVLKPGGRWYVSDLKRDLNPAVAWFMKVSVRPPEMRPGLQTSIDAAYTRSELAAMAAGTPLKSAEISENPFGLHMRGMK